MKTNILTLITVLLAIFLTSCEKEIEFNGEQSDPKLVINSLVEPSQPVKAHLSKSYFFLDNQANTAAPDDVVAELYVNGNRIGPMTRYVDTLWESYQYYDFKVLTAFVSDYCPQAGDLVKITAAANNFDDVEAETSPLPNAVDYQIEVEVTDWHSWYQHDYNYETQEYEEDSILEVWGDLELTLTLADPNPGKTDCFRLSTRKNYNTYDGENMRYISYEYDDPVFGGSFSENDFFDASDLDTRPEGVFTDLLFDGGSYRLKLKISFNCYIDEVFDPDFFHVPFLLEHLSKEYYNYLNTCNQGDEVAFQIYSEPIQTFSNVNGGFGIVAGRTADTLWVSLPIEEP